MVLIFELKDTREKIEKRFGIIPSRIFTVLTVALNILAAFAIVPVFITWLFVWAAFYGIGMVALFPLYLISMLIERTCIYSIYYIMTGKTYAEMAHIYEKKHHIPSSPDRETISTYYFDEIILFIEKLSPFYF